MEQTVRVYRGSLRNVVLCVAFAFGTVFCATGAVVNRPSIGAMVAFGLGALLALYVCFRVAVMKAVATPNGLTLHGPLLTVTVPWERVAQVVGDDTETDFHVLPVRAPVLVLTNGRRVKVRQASSYDLSVRSIRHNTNTRADHIAAELEAMRVAYSARPATSVD
jgi:hypothetical protein